MNKCMNCKEIGDKIKLGEYTTRIILCRQEFSKYATYHKSKVGYARISYKIKLGFLDNLLEILELKRLGKQADIVRRWKNEYIGVL
jgi:hypothetical protein